MFTHVSFWFGLLIGFSSALITVISVCAVTSSALNWELEKKLNAYAEKS